MGIACGCLETFGAYCVGYVLQYNLFNLKNSLFYENP